jgi:5-(carboxyamino)imidazole ribonucleotide synthase
MKTGILGGGQLAGMLVMAGIPLGFDFTVLTPDSESCAAQYGKLLLSDYSDKKALHNLADWSDLITFEFENIPAESINYLDRYTDVRPGLKSLKISQDRLHEKEFFSGLGIPCVPFYPVNSLKDLHKAADIIGLPAVLKCRTHGYDGKGQVVLRHIEESESAFNLLGGQPGILEKFIDFDREISVVAVRSISGETAFYTISENIHHNGILHLAMTQPCDPVQEKAEFYAGLLLENLNYSGVLALEFFQTGNSLIANEYAPRVHNSGHWTIEGAKTSQFENHLRAISGMCLGSTALKSVAATVNLIGSVPDRAQIPGNSNIYLHDYGKAPRPGRKVGHITVCADNMRDLGKLVPEFLIRQQLMM